MISKFATARWNGSLKEGAGTLTTESGALSGTPYSHATRFTAKAGANPEELVGAAHAGCYAMFLSALMTGAGIVPDSIEAVSTVTLDPATPGSPTVTGAHLVATVKADAPEAKIRELAEKAKADCPISKLLKADVTLELRIG